MINKIIDFIKECIMQKNGKKLYTKTKVLITKGPKDRFVIDRFKLDEITTGLTG